MSRELWRSVALSGLALLAQVAPGTRPDKPILQSNQSPVLLAPLPDRSSASSLLFAPVLQGSQGTFFPPTGKLVPDNIYEYWQGHGSLKLIGYPSSQPITESDSGEPLEVQYFERQRLEYHPEIADPQFKILGGLIGDEAYYPKYGAQGAPDQVANKSKDSVFFKQTQKHLGGAFLAHWKTDGDMKLLGYPISDEFKEPAADGNIYTVQYFERGKMELHSENKAPYDVLYAQLGKEILQKKHPDQQLRNKQYGSLPQGLGFDVGYQDELEKAGLNPAYTQQELDGLPGSYIDYRTKPKIPLNSEKHPYIRMIWTGISAEEVQQNKGATWILGNEPNDAEQQNQTPEQYIQFYLKYARIIRDADPTAAIVLAGLGDATFQHHTPEEDGDPVIYLEKVLKGIEAADPTLLPTAVDAHLANINRKYDPFDTRPLVEYLDRLIEMLNRNPATAGMPIIIGELGVPPWTTDILKTMKFMEDMVAIIKDHPQVVETNWFAARTVGSNGSVTINVGGSTGIGDLLQHKPENRQNLTCPGIEWASLAQGLSGLSDEACLAVSR